MSWLRRPAKSDREAAAKHRILISLPSSNRPDLAHHPALFLKSGPSRARRGAACEVHLMQHVAWDPASGPACAEARLDKHIFGKPFFWDTGGESVFWTNRPLGEQSFGQTVLWTNRPLDEPSFWANRPFTFLDRCQRPVGRPGPRHCSWGRWS